MIVGAIKLTGLSVALEDGGRTPDDLSVRAVPAHWNDPDPDALSPCQACRLAMPRTLPRTGPGSEKSRVFFMGHGSVVSQENASDVLAGITIDHHEVDIAVRPLVHLVEADRIKLVVNKNGSGVDG